MNIPLCCFILKERRKKCEGLTIIHINAQFNLEELILIDALGTRVLRVVFFLSCFIFAKRTNVINDDIKECGLRNS